MCCEDDVCECHGCCDNDDCEALNGTAKGEERFCIDKSCKQCQLDSHCPSGTLRAGGS